MELEKLYDIVDWIALWEVLKICGEGGKLLNGTELSYKNSKVGVKVDGRLSENFEIRMKVRHGCVMPSWLFNIYIWLGQ